MQIYIHLSKYTTSLGFKLSTIFVLENFTTKSTIDTTYVSTAYQFKPENFA